MNYLNTNCSTLQGQLSLEGCAQLSSMNSGLQKTRAVTGRPQCNRGIPGFPGKCQKKCQNADFGGLPENVQYNRNKMSNGVPETSILDPPENDKNLRKMSKIWENVKIGQKMYIF